MVRVFSHSTIKIKGEEGVPLKVNSPLMKHNVGPTKEMSSCEKLKLGKV